MAIVSGGASGMGQSEAMLVAREGAKVIVADVLETEGRQTADKITAGGGQAKFVKLDVTSEANWQSTVEAAVSTAQNVITNIYDQYRQRGRHATTDDELIRKLASGKELASQLKRGSAERGVNTAIVVAAAAADAETVERAATAVIRAYRRQNIGPRRWRGSQKTLWRAFNPGAENSAALSEFRNPATTTGPTDDRDGVTP